LLQKRRKEKTKAAQGSITASNHDPQKKRKIHRRERPKRIRAKINNEDEEEEEGKIHIHHYT
jgi:hypothetical protein